MSFGIFNSTFNKRGYVDPHFEDVWGERHTLECWFQVEAALAGVQAELGIIPEQAARHIQASATVTEKLLSEVSNGGGGNPLIVGLDAIRTAVGKEYRGWVHYGATSQDILDTARALQIKESLEIFQSNLNSIIASVQQLAHQHAHTLMVARTNGQHALPTTLGTRFARWLTALKADVRRINSCQEDALSIQFSGAAGTYASTGTLGPKIAQRLSETLGLTYRFVPWHADRSAITELCTMMAIHGQNLAKIAEDLFDMQRNEIGEAHEMMDAHLSGSSAMPQKKNPFSTMKISVAGRIAAGAAATLLTQPPAAHERDHRQLEVERDLLPRTLIAVEGAQRKLLALLPNLVFDVEQLAANLCYEGPLILTEHILMELAPTLGHEKAHDVLQEFASRYRESHISLQQFVNERPELQAALKDVDLDSLLAPDNYIGLSEEISLAQ